jgi:hypothetical protein
MTKRHLPKGRDFKTLGNIAKKWFLGNNPAFKTAGKNQGFVDHVTAKSQKLKRADFFVAPRFYIIDGQCMEIVEIAAVVR